MKNPATTTYRPPARAWHRGVLAGRLAAWLAALALMGCGGTPGPGSQTLPDPGGADPGGTGGAAHQGSQEGNRQGGNGQDSAPGDQADDGTLRASATAATRDEAYSAAVAELVTAVYGPERWVVDLGLPLHDAARDPVEESVAEDGRVTVTVGLGQERIAEVLTRLAAQPWQTSLPAILAEPIRESYQVYVERLVCQRRHELLGEDCEPPDVADIEVRLRHVAGAIELRPLYEGGVPTDASGRPLRPLRVIAEHVAGDGTRTPLAGMPMVAVQPEGTSALEALQAVSDQAGVVSFSFFADAQWPRGLRVALDRETLLGPLAAMWPVHEIEVATRVVEHSRWSALVVERVQGRLVRDGLFLATLDQVLRDSGRQGVTAVPDGGDSALATASAQQRAAMLPELADEWRGRVDRLVIVEVDSEYASRMGTHRVWYEARGHVHVYDVWTGKRLATLKESVTAAGVGDARADRAARAALAAKLADTLATLGAQPAS